MDTPFAPESIPSAVDCPAVNPSPTADVSRSNVDRRKEHIMKRIPIVALLITLALPAAAFAGALVSGPGDGPPGFDGPGDLLQLANTKGSVKPGTS
jgi:hypothetical protein